MYLLAYLETYIKHLLVSTVYKICEKVKIFMIYHGSYQKGKYKSIEKQNSTFVKPSMFHHLIQLFIFA